jgi:UDP-4-amino-4,6-dideoxy-N-acetyl-beta-L-altrosamine N-acetyltransferase
MKLMLRKIDDVDLEKIMNWRMLPEVTRYMYTDPKLTIEDQQRWYKSIRNDPTKKYWIINVDNEDVGLIGIYSIDLENHRCEWAYYLASPSVRGKGIGKSVELNILQYVFEDLGLNKLCCEVFCMNEIVIKIHQKYGSKIEGTRKAHIFKNDEYHDIVEMAIFSEDWRDRIKGQFDYHKADIA